MSRRRMLEPTKDTLRARLALAEARVAYLSAPWWVRAWAWVKGRLA